MLLTNTGGMVQEAFMRCHAYILMHVLRVLCEIRAGVGGRLFGDYVHVHNVLLYEYRGFMMILGDGVSISRLR